uniref:Uncharacterized protein n=1 Tax=Glossina pallidipes TaxID=7398 RepID=A0A1A9Z765_GLOPL
MKRYLRSSKKNEFLSKRGNYISNSRSEERSIQLAVRVHKTLELADDKFYVITCGKSGFGRKFLFTTSQNVLALG